MTLTYIMDIQARKIEFIKQFLKLQNENSITRLESVLDQEMTEEKDKVFEPMSVEELNKRIDQSESDFENNRFKSSAELLAKYE